VPSFIVDFTHNRHFLGLGPWSSSSSSSSSSFSSRPDGGRSDLSSCSISDDDDGDEECGRWFTGLAHVTDLLPTFLGFAGLHAHTLLLSEKLEKREEEEEQGGGKSQEQVEGTTTTETTADGSDSNIMAMSGDVLDGFDLGPAIRLAFEQEGKGKGRRNMRRKRPRLDGTDESGGGGVGAAELSEETSASVITDDDWSPRKEVLVDMYYEGESVWKGEYLEAIRIGNFKVTSHTRCLPPD